MSILQIFDQTTPLVSGYSMRSRYITDSLAQMGVPLKVISSPIFSYKSKQETINGVEYFRTSASGWKLISKIPVAKEMTVVNSIKNKADEIWSDDIKLVDAHSSVINGLAGLRIAKTHKVPFLYEIRAFWEDAAVDQGKTSEGSLRYNITRNMETDVIKQADKVTVICEGLKQDLLARGIPEKKIAVIPNGVDTESFQPFIADFQLKRDLRIENKIIFGFIGTFFEFEGLPLFLQAAQRVLVKRKDIRFLFVGGGREEEALKRQAEALGISDYVVFPGRIKHDDIQKYYSIVDIFVYPRISKRITELVTPLKPLESMSSGKIVIGSDVGGIKELVTDGKNGFLFKAGDVNDLVEKCMYVLNNFPDCLQLGMGSRDYVVKERNWSTICRRYLDIFKELGVKL